MSNNPGAINTIGPLTGVISGHAMRTIDFRPATGQLYGISTSTEGPVQAQIYVINTATAVCTPIATPVTLGTATSRVVNMDFNPAVDRIRLVTTGGNTSGNNNFRLHPDTGALVAVDTDLAFDAGDPQSGSYFIAAIAYSNNIPSTGVTTLYAWNYTNDSLLTIGGLNGTPSPNGGLMFTVNDPTPNFLTTNGGIGMDISSVTDNMYATHDSPTSSATMGIYLRDKTTGAEQFGGAYPAGTFIPDISVFIAPVGTPTPTPTPTPTATPTPTPTATPTPTPVPTTFVQFSSATYKDDESQSAVITVTRTGVLTGTSTVTFNTLTGGSGLGGAACTAGVDYQNTTQVLTFAPTVESQTVSIPLCPDLFFELDETVPLALSNPTGAGLGAPSTAVLTINDTANQFLNTTPIGINLGSLSTPSTINVTGAPTSVFRIRVTLYDLYHEFPDAIDVLLVGPNGARYMPMGDVGGPTPIAQQNHVTLTFFDGSPAVMPDNGPLTTGHFLPTTCETQVGNFPAPAPAGPYVQPGCTVARPANQTMYGNFGLINGNGAWTLYVRDDRSSFQPVNIVGEVSGGWGIELLPATSSGVSVSGRVLTAEGQGIRNARVVVTGNSLAEPMIVTTGAFGSYMLEGLRAGETYVVTVNSQRYTFAVPSRVVTLSDSVADFNFVAE